MSLFIKVYFINIANENFYFIQQLMYKNFLNCSCIKMEKACSVVLRINLINKNKISLWEKLSNHIPQVITRFPCYDWYSLKTSVFVTLIFFCIFSNTAFLIYLKRSLEWDIHRILSNKSIFKIIHIKKLTSAFDTSGKELNFFLIFSNDPWSAYTRGL